MGVFVRNVAWRHGRRVSFSFEDQVMPGSKSFCAVPGFGVLRRMEAPMDIPLNFINMFTSVAI